MAATLHDAAQGLGEALALHWAEQGARLVLSSRSMDKLQASAARCPLPAWCPAADGALRASYTLIACGALQFGALAPHCSPLLTALPPSLAWPATQLCVEGFPPP